MNHCKPFPLLLSLSKQDSRPVKEGKYSVTEILNPPQQVYLKRNNDYHARPDSLVDMHIGSAWHEKIEETKGFVQELGLQDDYLMEKKFKTYITLKEKMTIEEEMDSVVTLSGIFDLGVKSTKTLWDYKVMKYYYTFKYLSEGNWDDSTIPWQLNIYRVYGFPEAECLKILCYLKDFKLNMTEKYGLNQTEILQVPMIPSDKVKERVVDLLTEHVETQKTGKPRTCTEKERWFNKKGEPLRCEYYCAPSELCEQFAEEK
jgi:hypothetical protein